MRKQSSAIRVAYNMLKELEKEKTKKQSRPNIPKIKTATSQPNTLTSVIYKAEQYPTDKPVVFGSKRLFEKPCKNHLTGKAGEGLKKGCGIGRGILTA